MSVALVLKASKWFRFFFFFYPRHLFSLSAQFRPSSDNMRAHASSLQQPSEGLKDTGLLLGMCAVDHKNQKQGFQKLRGHVGACTLPIRWEEYLCSGISIFLGCVSGD